MALAACQARVVEATFIETGSGRPYKVFTAPGRDAARPLPIFFVLHAYATDPDVLVRTYLLPRRAVAERGWILVVPEGTRDVDGFPFWNASAACCGTGPMPADEVGYLHRVLENVRRRFGGDPGRTYAIGVSNGAFMAHRWACSAEADLRAIVSISGAAPGLDDPPCAPSAPVSVLHIHGDRDPTVRFEGGTRDRGRYPSARATAEIWRKLDVCEPAPRRARRWLPLFQWASVESWPCPRAKVALWTVEGGTHDIGGLRYRVDDLLDFLAGAPVPQATN